MQNCTGDLVPSEAEAIVCKFSRYSSNIFFINSVSLEKIICLAD